jgi:hypothetical protein
MATPIALRICADGAYYLHGWTSMIHWRKQLVLPGMLTPTQEMEPAVSNQPPYDQPPYNPQYPPSGGYPPQQPGGYYPPSQGGYPPSQGGYPPQQGGYYPAPDAYQQAQPYGYPAAPMAAPEKGGGFAIAGLILGIISIPIAVFLRSSQSAAISPLSWDWFSASSDSVSPRSARWRRLAWCSRSSALSPRSSARPSA